MPAAAVDEPRASLLPEAHRVIRSIAGHEGPFTGVLVTRDDGVALRVDAAALSGWEGWFFAGSEHVAGPLDVIRRTDGHDVLLPWCTERVGTLIAYRTAGGDALSSGECSTLLVSLLRALGELGEEKSVVGAVGTWWLTDAGRPVFVIGEGEEARKGVALLLGQLGEGCADKTLGRLIRAVETGLHKNIEQQLRVPRLLLEKWETELLDVAAPRPLVREVHAVGSARMATGAVSRGADAPSTANRSRARRSGHLPAARTRREPTRTGQRKRMRGKRLLRRSLAGVGQSVARHLRWFLRWESTPRQRREAGPTAGDRRGAAHPPRRRALVVAGAVALAVLAGGLLWPSDITSAAKEPSTGSAGAERSDAPASDAPASDASETVPPSASPGPVSSPSSQPSSADGESVDPVVAASSLLDSVAECGDSGDEVCPAAIAPGAVGIMGMLSSDESRSPELSLVDEYGDVAVIRLAREASDPTERSADGVAHPHERMMVIVRINEKWLVRDVYDVADQPE